MIYSARLILRRRCVNRFQDGTVSQCMVSGSELKIYELSIIIAH